MEQLTPQMLRERTRERLRSNFSAFAQAAWKVIEPKGLEWNWHLELECEYLQLAYERQVLRLIVTVPPRTLKSRLISVLFACWAWAKDPALSFLFTSYSDSLSDELSILRRSLLQSKWFQEMFPGQVQFAADQNQKSKYQNLRKGQMIATSMGAVALGVGADFLLIDDALSPEQSYSDAERSNVNRAFDGTFRSRLNEAERGVIVIIAQRLHESDLIGHVLTNEPGVWTHINLPMIAETDEEIIFPLSGRALHRKAGDLLFPQRFSKKWCEKQRATIGSYLWSSQYMQRPGVLGGAVFKRDWFRQYSELPQEKKGMTILSLDTAFSTKKTADYSVATVWTSYGTGFFLRYVWRERVAYPHLRAMTEALAEDFAVEAVLVEEKGSGQSLLQSLKQETSLPIVGIQVDTDKVSRAHGVSALFESGRVFFPKDEPWMPTYLHELELFPSGAHDDCVDSTVQALAYLRGRTYSGGVLGMVKLLQKFDKFGLPEVRKAGALVTGVAGQVVSVRDRPAKCPLCDGPRIWMSHGMDANRLVAFCNQDHSKDGILPVATDNPCSHYPDGQHKMVATGGAVRCNGCQYTPDTRAVQSYNGATKKQTEALKEEARYPVFSRRRWGQRWGI
jgi:predicted phage terminase large subunit-like protein